MQWRIWAYIYAPQNMNQGFSPFNTCFGNPQLVSVVLLFTRIIAGFRVHTDVYVLHICDCLVLTVGVHNSNVFIKAPPCIISLFTRMFRIQEKERERAHYH